MLDNRHEENVKLSNHQKMLIMRLISVNFTFQTQIS